MGKGGSTKTPPPMDTAAIGAQQNAANQGAFNTNINAARPNQSNPFANLTWDQDPTTGQWTQNVGLNDQQQGIFNQQQSNQGAIANAAGGLLGGFDQSQIRLNNDLPTIGQYNQQATDLTRQLMQPDLDRATDANRARAAAMGLGFGSGRANDNMEFQNSQRLNDASLKSALAGIQQGNTMFGQGMQLNQQGNQNIMNERAANLGNLSGLMGLGQAQGNPQFQNVGQTPQMGAVDYTGLANQSYQQQLDASNASNADKANKNASTQQAIGTVATVAAIAF